MFGKLMVSRRFAPIFWCQFLSALSDNFVKNALVILVLFRLGSENTGALVTLASAILIAPFLLLSGVGGELADKHDKARVAQALKLAEIPVAMIAAAGFLLGSIVLLFLALGLLGIIAALFGPVKYGILPDHLDKSELPAANALVEGATFLAILLGTVAGGLAAAGENAGGLLAGTVSIFALLCWATALLIPRTGAAAPEIRVTANPVRSTVRLVAELRTQPRLLAGGLISSWFWLVGIVALSLLPIIVKEHLGGSPETVTLGLFVFTLGIATGSMLAARASRFGPNLNVVPLGGLLMGLVSLDLAWTVAHMQPATTALMPLAVLRSASGLHLVADLFVLAAAGGLFIVPTFAAVQAWAAPDRRARVVAGVNVLNAVLMTAGSLLLIGLQLAGVAVPRLLLLLGLANIAVAAAIVRVWSREGILSGGLRFTLSRRGNDPRE
jgi:acyl-[acyl-carrier-protein]-phospholipid O-acyltransferase/long-chain-fatty-acid--[acyl-carrier-protein] ligase